MKQDLLHQELEHARRCASAQQLVGLVEEQTIGTLELELREMFYEYTVHTVDLYI